MADRYEDKRGIIQDLLGKVDGITEIVTWEGFVRGNHVHQRTEQWTYVTDGLLLAAWTEDDGVHTRQYGPGSLIRERAGVPHAWKAVTDCRVLVFTQGPRTGESYEEDTTRLPENARLLS